MPFLIGNSNFIGRAIFTMPKLNDVLNEVSKSIKTLTKCND